MAKKDSNKSQQDVSKKTDSERTKALDAALLQIEKQFGKGAVMRLGEQASMVVDAVPTGALTLDLALGVGGLPKGRIIEIYGPESSGKTTVALHVVAESHHAVAKGIVAVEHQEQAPGRIDNI